jgi:hypothetical protein
MTDAPAESLQRAAEPAHTAHGRQAIPQAVVAAARAAMHDE